MSNSLIGHRSESQVSWIDVFALTGLFQDILSVLLKPVGCCFTEGLGLLFCWKVDLHPSLKSLEASSTFFFLSIFLRLSFSQYWNVKKHPHNMILPSICFAVGRCLHDEINIFFYLSSNKNNLNATNSGSLYKYSWMCRRAAHVRIKHPASPEHDHRKLCSPKCLMTAVIS